MLQSKDPFNVRAYRSTKDAGSGTRPDFAGPDLSLQPLPMIPVRKHGTYIRTRGGRMGKLLAMPKTAQIAQWDETQLRQADVKNQDSAELLRGIKDRLAVLSKRAKSEPHLKMILADIEMLDEFNHKCFDQR